MHSCKFHVAVAGNGCCGVDADFLWDGGVGDRLGYFVGLLVDKRQVMMSDWQVS